MKVRAGPACPEKPLKKLNDGDGAAVQVGMMPAFQATCLDALTDSASELASTVLGGLEVASSGPDCQVAAGHGAYLGLVAEEEPIQVGLLCEPAGCQILAKSLLGMDPADEDLPIADVSDAMCEIINIVAGGLKRRISGKVAVTLGLPIFVAGHPLPNPQQEIWARELKIGPVPVSLLVVTQKQQAAPLSRSATAAKVAGLSPSKEQSAS